MNVACYRLSNGQREISLPPKAWDVLYCLIKLSSRSLAGRRASFMRCSAMATVLKPRRPSAPVAAATLPGGVTV
jgi:hypothetical protein